MTFLKTLISWYSNNKRELPWRQTTNPYYIWLSEIILQQTQIVQGQPYYEAFIKEFPSIFHLASAQESQVLKLWQGLGYYSRARNLHATAKYIVDELNGVFPNTYKELLKLKGVGDYTASAIASICFNEPMAVVDGNVYRVLSRYFGINTPINSSNGAKAFKQLAQQLIDKNNPAEYNQAIMEFGAVQCKPQNPNCSVCPFQNSCVALQNNRISELPVKIKAAKAKKKCFNFLVLVSEDNKTVLEKRNGKGIWQNLYQFPLIETQQEKNYEDLLPLVKEHHLLKEIPFELTQYNEDTIIHRLSHQHLYTKFWIVTLNAPLANGIPISEVRNYAVPIVIGNFIDAFNFQ
ncbi:A/G-specific adenine glycosylase [Confluentibacter flavum]|uniref:Adenine DNA glycosylase n=1 Tax=Confluentibacter flavum TaxID=1909700 RepID=A0A2N3HI61_9FLAO|nr:A/G-specific adenine glycosylase [Confluentibacter flavum]PKQ44680.1 A/G-specific adenine glycosylase [Confluentibacter flavum]